MEGDQSGLTFVLKIDENGRHIYSLQPTGERYELDEENQEMIEIQDPGLGLMPSKRIKLEQQDLDPLEVPPVVTEMDDDEIGEEVEHEVLLAEEGVPEVHTPGDTELCVRSRRQIETETLGGLITQNTDIQEPLSTLKALLERRFQVELDGYEFWLQDKQMLESHRTLVEQCVQGEGIVQVNLQVKVVGDSKRINIEDVLKPADEYSDMLEETMRLEEEEEVPGRPAEEEDQPNSIVRWIVDSQFKRDAERLKIPHDPLEWTMPHVRHWLQWAVRQFNLVGLKLSDWQMTGHDLCNLSLADFKAKVKSDPGDIFWTHLELLRKCKFVAVVQNKESVKSVGEMSSVGKPRSRPAKLAKGAQKLSRVIGMPVLSEYAGAVSFSSQAGNRTGNNGQVQLWQFLLELLTDKEHRHVIQWIGNEGEFKLVNPEIVARLWGERKNKPTMNYEKLSRALRYYYDGDMICKVHGKRFVYKYACDLKQLIGYSPNELNRLCAEAAISNNILVPLEELNYEEC